MDREEQEKKINALPQFVADIKDDNGIDFEVHCMALFSQKKDAIPIALDLSVQEKTEARYQGAL